MYLIVYSRAIGPMPSFPIPSSTCSQLAEFRVRCGEVDTSPSKYKLTKCHNSSFLHKMSTSLQPQLLGPLSISAHVYLIQNLTRALCVGRGCCYSENSGCYHFMPSKHQFVLEAGSAVGAGHSVVYPLVPMSPTSAYGFTMTERVFCEINEISRRRLQITVHNSVS